MRIATWNVNSLKVRLEQLLDWLKQDGPDVVCLQETKLDDPKFPAGTIEQAGYHVVFSGQKTYNGVAIISREPCSGVVRGIPGYADEQKRVFAAGVTLRGPYQSGPGQMNGTIAIGGSTIGIRKTVRNAS